MALTSDHIIRISEREFLQQIRDLSRVFRWKTYHTHMSKFSEKGFPDLTLVRDGHLIFSELKTDAGRVTPAQAEWIEALDQCRIVEVAIWRPRDWDAIVARMK